VGRVSWGRETRRDGFVVRGTYLLTRRGKAGTGGEYSYLADRNRDRDYLGGEDLSGTRGRAKHARRYRSSEPGKRTPVKGGGKGRSSEPRGSSAGKDECKGPWT